MAFANLSPETLSGGKIPPPTTSPPPRRVDLPPLRLAVVGSAGRQQDASRVTPELWSRMRASLSGLITGLQPTCLVSGGAAFADHLAVAAFLDGEVPELRLHLPAKFARGAYHGSRDASTANRYHGAASTRLGFNSLDQLQQAFIKGARIGDGPLGFLPRNGSIAADCDELVAFTFGGETARYLPGEPGFDDPDIAGLGGSGTKDTWRRAWRVRSKRHVSLLKLNPG